MSSSPPSSAPSSDAALEQALRHAVRQLYKRGDLENLTVKRIRRTVESDLNLEEDFFKSNARWTSKSKLAIQAEVDAHTEAGEASSLPSLSQSRTTPPKPQDQHRKPRGTKRASTEKAGPKKRRRKNDSEGDGSSHEQADRRKGSTAKSKVSQQVQKRYDSDAEDLASEVKDDSAEADFEDDEEREEAMSMKVNGTRMKRNRSRCDSPEQDYSDEEEDVKPAKTKSNKANSRDARTVKKASHTEKAPKKHAEKTAAIKRSSSPSLSANAEDEERMLTSEQSEKLPSDDGTRQTDPESEMSEVIDEPPKAKQSRKSKAAESKTEKTNPKHKPTKPKEPSEQLENADLTKAEHSDSSMSVLIDEPAKTKQPRKSSSTQANPTKPNPTKAKSTKIKNPTTSTPSDPDTEEIKRLQSQLVKCGIRKMWFKELAPYATSKPKIKHLKQMLMEAGMTGRFSEAKAEQIREERELRADLEAVQEGERKWGKVEEKDDGKGGTRKRGLAKGFEGLGFLNDDDGEETD